MSKALSPNNPSGRKAYIITGPTSGIGRATAFELAKHGTVAVEPGFSPATALGREANGALSRRGRFPPKCAAGHSLDVSVASGERTAAFE